MRLGEVVIGFVRFSEVGTSSVCSLVNVLFLIVKKIPNC